MAQPKKIARVSLFGSRNDDGVSFDPTRDIPSLTGKVILITGAVGGLGRQMAVQLARYGRPARLYIADLPRKEGPKKELLHSIAREAYGEVSKPEDIKITSMPSELRYLNLDLTLFESVHKCASDIAAREERLDILVLNAGTMRVAAGTTEEGYEVHFGLNYLGHALLARLLVSMMVRTKQKPGADVRIIIVSSEKHAVAPEGGIRFDRLKTGCAEMVRFELFC